MSRILGYRDKKTGEIYCSPCAHRMDLDIELEDSPWTALSDSEEENPGKKCDRCWFLLEKANCIGVCPACGQLRTFGGGIKI